MIFNWFKDNVKCNNNLCEDAFTSEALQNMTLSDSLLTNIEMINNISGKNCDLSNRSFTLGRTSPVNAMLFYIHNLIDSKIVDANVMQPLIIDTYKSGLKSSTDIIKYISLGNVITSEDISTTSNMMELFDGLLDGEAVLLIDGVNEAILMNARGQNFRKPSEAQVETVVRGPRDSFNEVLSVNLSLIRRRIHNPNLTFESRRIGKISQTKICIGYLKGVCSAELVEEVISRVDKIKTDFILGDSYIEELINDKPLSFFPQMRNTERPDVASAALLEGRVIILVDSSPVALIIPGEFLSLFQSAEDYYNRYIFSSFVRILRFFALIIALTLPSFYLAIVNFHQELIPTKLLISIIASRNGVPLPNFLEALLMETTFEILREAGVRLPRPVGQAVSIVGALVIGQAAVQASLVSPLMVIVVSLTGIATFTIPQYNISLPVRLIRLILMILAAVLGLYGIMLGLLFILIHLCSIKSFGTPYLAPITPFNKKGVKDTIIRAPHSPGNHSKVTKTT